MYASARWRFCLPRASMQLSSSLTKWDMLSAMRRKTERRRALQRRRRWQAPLQLFVGRATQGCPKELWIAISQSEQRLDKSKALT